MKRPLAWLLLLAAVPALAAPLKQAGAPNDALARGVAALDAGQPRVARVEFMNAIRAAPRDPRPHLLQARTALLLEDGVAAEAELRRARDLGTPDVETRHMLAEALLLQGKPDAALGAAAGASRYPGAAAHMRARAHDALGNSGEAARAYADALRLAPRDGRLWLDVARFRLRLGERAGAIVAADTAIRLQPRHVPGLVLRGILVRSQYGGEAALPWFARARAIDPEHAPAWIEEAATLGDLGRTRAMLAATREALALRPDDARARYLQAVLAARARNWPLARALWARVTGPAASTPGALLLGATIDLEGGDAGSAANRLERLVAAQPGNFAARRLLGLAHLRTGDGPRTVEALRALEGEAVADPYALTLLAGGYAKAGNTDVARRAQARAAVPGGASGLMPAGLGGALDTPAFAQAAAIRRELATGSAWAAVSRARALAAESPGAPDAHLILGDALMLVGAADRAAAAYRDAANIAFTEPAALRLVEAFQAAGQAEDARVTLALFLKQNPQSLPAHRLLANMRLAARDWPGAVAMYERVQARTGPHDAVLLANLAWARFEGGDAPGGLADATRAYRLAPGNLATADAWGWMLLKTGRERPAAAALLGRAWLER